jgi:hypothetical protein
MIIWPLHHESHGWSHFFSRSWDFHPKIHDIRVKNCQSWLKFSKPKRSSDSRRSRSHLELYLDSRPRWQTSKGWNSCEVENFEFSERGLTNGVVAKFAYFLVGSCRVVGRIIRKIYSFFLTCFFSRIKVWDPVKVLVPLPFNAVFCFLTKK